MPELPEVETIARTLAPQVEGRRIVACELLLHSARIRCLLWTRLVRPVRWPGALPAGMNALPGLGSISK